MPQSLGANNQPVASRLAAFAFGISIIGLGVPVTCVVMRNNLEVGRVLSRRGALFASAVLPYLLSWTLYRGHRILDRGLESQRRACIRTGSSRDAGTRPRPERRDRRAGRHLVDGHDLQRRGEPRAAGTPLCTSDTH